MKSFLVRNRALPNDLGWVKCHVSDYFQLFQPELNATQSLTQEIWSKLLENASSIDGFNIVVNS